MTDRDAVQDEVDEFFEEIGQRLAAQGVADPQARYRLVLELIVNNPDLLERVPPELRPQLLEAAASEGLLKGAHD